MNCILYTNVHIYIYIYYVNTRNTMRRIPIIWYQFLMNKTGEKYSCKILSQYTRFLCRQSKLAEFHPRNSFSAICVYFLVSFLIFWRAQRTKFKMATSGHIENLIPNKIVLETAIISLFLLIIVHRAHFWHHLCILISLNVEIQDGRPLSFPLFSDLSHSIHFSCWMSHHKLVSSNICWFYRLLLHIFPQWSPRKIENQSYLVRSFWIGVTKWIAMQWLMLQIY